MNSPRVALMGMILESNRYSKPASKADFESLTWMGGNALMAEARSDAPSLAQEFAAFVRAMDATGRWTPVPVLLAASHPHGPVEEAVFEEYAEAIVKALSEPVDAVYLCHHGAMVATHLNDPDGELARRVRAAVGPDVPIIQTLDLHANISDTMCDNADLIIGYGPGVADMKAGLVMNAFLLAAFARFGGARAPMVGLFTGDEEIGSPTSRPYIEAEARNACAVFNSEPGRLSGNVVTGRKGGIFFHCEVTGKAAHSGANFQDGVSAIEELARKIQAFHALTDLRRGQTINVGLISGGQSVNTVAPHAECQIDLRYVEPDDRGAIVDAIERIVRKCSVEGTSASIRIIGEFRPLKQSPQDKALFDQYVGSARDIGLSVGGEFSGGCADSGFAAAVGAPTVCGTGPVGSKAHSPEEFLELNSIVPRAQALALTVLRLT